MSTPRPTVFCKSRVGGAIGPRPEPAGGHTRPGLGLLRAHTGGGASTDPAPRNWNRGCECWGLSYGDTHVTEHHTVRGTCVTVSTSGRTRTRTHARGSRGHRAQPGGGPPGPGGDYARIRTGDGTAGSEAAGRARASREGWQRGRLRGVWHPGNDCPPTRGRSSPGQTPGRCPTQQVSRQTPAVWAAWSKASMSSLPTGRSHQKKPTRGTFYRGTGQKLPTAKPGRDRGGPPGRGRKTRGAPRPSGRAVWGAWAEHAAEVRRRERAGWAQAAGKERARACGKHTGALGSRPQRGDGAPRLGRRARWAGRHLLRKPEAAQNSRKRIKTKSPRGCALPSSQPM